MSPWRRLLNHFLPHHTNAYRPHLLRRGWMVFFLAAVLMTEGFLVASLVARQSGGSFLAAIVQSELIAMTNDERAQNDVGTLAENAQLDAAAQAKANDMAAKGYFAHRSPDGKEPWDFIAAAGYNYQYAGENLAVRFVDSKDVVNAWMASPTHRANIVKPQYTQVGIGIAEGMYQGEPATFVVQYFGAPEPVAAPAPARAAHVAQGSPAPAKAPAVAATPAATQVLGAEVGPAPAASKLDSAVRQLPRLLGNPRGSAAWVLGGIAALIILLLGLTFVMHLQVQPTDLLLPGIAVVGIAAFLLAFNSMALGGSSLSAAAALGQGQSSGVVIDPSAAVWSR